MKSVSDKISQKSIGYDWRATHIAALDKVSGNKQVLLVGADLDIVRPDDGLRLVGVVEPLDVVQV